MVHLRERIVVESDRVMGDLGDDHTLMGIMRHCECGSGQCGMIKVDRVTLRWLVAVRGLSKVWMEDERVVAVVDRDRRVGSGNRRIRHRRIVHEGAPAAVARELKIAEDVGAAETQVNRIGAISHGQHTIGIPVLDRVETDTLEVDLIRAGERAVTGETENLASER